MRKNRKNITHIKCQLYVSFPFYSFLFPWSPLYPYLFTFRRQQVYPPASWLSVCVLTSICERSHFILSPLSDSDFLNELNYSVQLTHGLQTYFLHYSFLFQFVPSWILILSTYHSHCRYHLPYGLHFQNVEAQFKGLNFSLELCICVFSPKLYPTSWSLLTFIPRTP